MPLIQDVPMLTVYRTGMVNLNGEATRLMHTAHLDVDLLPPSRAKHANKGGDAWQLDRRPGSPCNLLGAHGRGILRFRAPARVEQLFADQPASVARLRFELCPAKDGLQMYALRAVQQNPRPETCIRTPLG